MDILPLYFILFLALPFILRLAQRSCPLALVTSASVWAAANVWQLNLPGSLEGEWFFNPLAWQLILTLGVVTGLQLSGPSADSACQSPVVLYGSVAYLVFSLIFVAPWTRLPFAALQNVHLIPADALGPMSKTYASGWRISHVLCLMYVFGWFVRRDARWLRQGWAAKLCGIGRVPLKSFAVATIAALVGTILLTTVGRGLVMHVLVNGLGIGALVFATGRLDVQPWAKAAVLRTSWHRYFPAMSHCRGRTVQFAGRSPNT